MPYAYSSVVEGPLLAADLHANVQAGARDHVRGVLGLVGGRCYWLLNYALMPFISHAQDPSSIPQS